jgi:hypothetical protein
MAPLTSPAIVTGPIVAAPVVNSPVGIGAAPRQLEWGPVILGALGATAVSVVLLTFGAALGLSAVSPYPYAGLSARASAVLAGTYTALVMVGAFAVGGYLAGRLRTPWPAGVEAEQHFRDGAHGFGVWAVGVVIGACLVAGGAGAAMKAAVQSTTVVAAAGAAGAANNPGRVSLDPTVYAADRLLAPNLTPAGPVTPAIATRADLAAPMARTFAVGLRDGQLAPRDRTYLAQLVMQQTGLSQADAEKRVDDTFAELKAAEMQARAAAETARKAALIAAFVAAATLAVGCAAACAGAALGARHRDENTVVAFLGSRRFW